MGDEYLADASAVTGYSASDLDKLAAAPRVAGSTRAYPNEAQPQEQSGTRREQVEKTTSLPFSSVCQVVVRAPDGETLYGSGWVAGPSTVVTAGHMTFRRGQGFVEKVTVFPGVDGRDFIPAQLPGVRWTTTDQFQTLDATQAERFDYGIIKIDGEFFGKAHPLRFDAYSPKKLVGQAASVIGYPVDKPWGTMWGCSGEIAAVDAGQLQYPIVTSPGDSGSPVYASFGRVIGIHTYGAATCNLATYISDSVATQLQQWIETYESA